MILNESGKEIEKTRVGKLMQYVKEKPNVVIATVPLTGAMSSVLIHFVMFLYRKGSAIYFGIPDEYILLGNSFSLYGIIVTGIIFLAYSGVAVLTVRIWLRRDCWLKRVICTFLMPMLFIFVFEVICMDNPNHILDFGWAEWLYLLLYMILIMFFLHLPVVVGIGYCLAFPLHEDIIRKKKKLKVRKKVRQKKYLNKRDKWICATTYVAITFSFYVVITMFWGYKDASRKNKFNIVHINDQLYICVMNDGESLTLKRAKYEDQVLSIYASENMLVKSKGYLLEEVQYESVKVEQTID